jgi:asparagine synthase (glutamine-hydrolysing)
MFAIAFWNQSQRKLTLIRDRLGVKPLYYGWDGKTLWFGSELKALRAYQHWHPEIDSKGLSEYFQFGNINAPRTIYKNVYKLAPGHILELNAVDGPAIRPYWSVLDVVGNPLQGSEDDLAEQLEALMIDAFRLRMVSDVPVGMFLSGGIDSSLVTALLQKHHGNIHTFTIGFNEPKYNEADHARLVAGHLGTNHTERILETSEASRILPSWGNLYDEPFHDSSGIPTYLVSKMASEQVKVVLSADGGDELFSGYNSYTGMLAHADKRNRLPDPLRQAFAASLRSLPLDLIDEMMALSPLPSSLVNTIRHKLTWRSCRIRDYLAAQDDGAMYEQALSFWTPDEISHLTGNYAGVRETASTYPGNFAEELCLWDLHNYLPSDILTKVDRATMAVSIEGREPLIDHRIVEFGFRLPLNFRRGSLGPKHILRKILYKYVPRELIERPKMGFGIPLCEWLRGDLAYLVDRHMQISDITAQGILNPDMVDKTIKRFRNGDDTVLNKVWTLLAFQMWREKWA